MKRRQAPLFGGWALYAASFFLPVVRDADQGPIPGWDALTAALGLRGYEASALEFASGLTNLVMVATALVLWVRVRRFVRLLFALMVVATVLNLSWFALGDRADLWLGYYAWWASFAVVTVGLRLREDDLVTNAA